MSSPLRILRSLLKLALGRGRRVSYGQFGEDAVVQSLLKNPRGTYVDVGAFDPILYSNTFALYRRGWHGLVIDPNQSLALPYKVFRPRDTFICAAVGSTGTGTYYSFVDASYNTFDGSAAQRWQHERGVRLLGTSSVAFNSLASILEENGIEQIDYLNVDVEGLDLLVLASHNWDIRPRIISVEDDGFETDRPRDSEVYRYLREKEYVLAGFSRQTLVFRDERPR